MNQCPLLNAWGVGLYLKVDKATDAQSKKILNARRDCVFLFHMRGNKTFIPYLSYCDCYTKNKYMQAHFIKNVSFLSQKYY